MEKIQAYIFDVDGVVVIAQKRIFSEMLVVDHGLCAEAIKSFFTGPFQKCLTGELDLKVELSEWLPKMKWDGSLDDFLGLWFASAQNIDEQLLKHITTLRARDFPVFLVTNNEKYRTKYIFHGLGLANYFDQTFSSSSIGYKKPQKEFYNAISEKIGTKAVHFWDDDEKNVIGAREAGWHATHYKSIDDFLTVINSK